MGLGIKIEGFGIKIQLEKLIYLIYLVVFYIKEFNF